MTAYKLDSEGRTKIIEVSPSATTQEVGSEGGGSTPKSDADGKPVEGPPKGEDDKPEPNKLDEPEEDKKKAYEEKKPPEGNKEGPNGEDPEPNNEKPKDQGAVKGEGASDSDVPPSSGIGRSKTRNDDVKGKSAPEVPDKDIPGDSAKPAQECGSVVDYIVRIPFKRRIDICTKTFTGDDIPTQFARFLANFPSNCGDTETAIKDQVWLPEKKQGQRDDDRWAKIPARPKGVDGTICIDPCKKVVFFDKFVEVEKLRYYYELKEQSPGDPTATPPIPATSTYVFYAFVKGKLVYRWRVWCEEVKKDADGSAVANPSNTGGGMADEILPVIPGRPPFIASVPEGCCCRILEGIKLLESNIRVKEQPNVGPKRFGHSFSIEIPFQLEQGESAKPCAIQWWENSSVAPSALNGALGSQNVAGKWNNLASPEIIDRIGGLQGLRSELAQNALRDCEPPYVRRAFKMNDAPSVTVAAVPEVGKTWERTLYIVIRAYSGCDGKGYCLALKQYLKLERRSPTIVRRSASFQVLACEAPAPPNENSEPDLAALSNPATGFPDTLPETEDVLA